MNERKNTSMNMQDSFMNDPLQGNDTVEGTSPNGLRTIDNLALKQNMYMQINFGIFLAFNVLKML